MSNYEYYLSLFCYISIKVDFTLNNTAPLFPHFKFIINANFYILDCTGNSGCVRRVSAGVNCRSHKDCKGFLVCKKNGCINSRADCCMGPSKLVQCYFYYQMHSYAESFKTLQKFI